MKLYLVIVLVVLVDGYCCEIVFLMSGVQCLKQV